MERGSTRPAPSSALSAPAPALGTHIPGPPTLGAASVLRPSTERKMMVIEGGVCGVCAGALQLD